MGFDSLTTSWSTNWAQGSLHEATSTSGTPGTHGDTPEAEILYQINALERFADTAQTTWADGSSATESGAGVIHALGVSGGRTLLEAINEVRATFGVPAYSFIDSATGRHSWAFIEDMRKAIGLGLPGVEENIARYDEASGTVSYYQPAGNNFIYGQQSGTYNHHFILGRFPVGDSASKFPPLSVDQSDKYYIMAAWFATPTAVDFTTTSPSLTVYANLAFMESATEDPAADTSTYWALSTLTNDPATVTFFYNVTNNTTTMSASTLLQGASGTQTMLVDITDEVSSATLSNPIAAGWKLLYPANQALGGSMLSNHDHVDYLWMPYK